MSKQEFVSKSPEETAGIGEHLARYAQKGDIICFFGDLGSGKTTLIKGIAKGLKISPQKVSSPTFVLMNAYQGRLPLFHFDLYRLEDAREISTIGCDEFLYDDGVSVIEWADRLGTFFPEEYLRVDLKHRKLDERVIRVSAKGERYQSIVDKIKIQETRNKVQTNSKSQYSRPKPYGI
jgi:tRNA threonylcarbamoyladenosine biosynthesis protein TsaE